MQCNLSAVRPERSSRRRILFCLFLLSAAMLAAWWPPPSLAGKIVAVGRGDNCPVGTLCGQASSDGRHRTAKHGGGQGDARIGYNIFGRYLQGYFKDIENGNSATGESTDDRASGSDGGPDEYDEIFLLIEVADGIPGYYAYTFGEMNETDGNAILLGDNVMEAATSGYEEDLSDFTPKVHGVVATGRAKRTTGGGIRERARPSSYVSLAADFDFDSPDREPAQNRVKFLDDGQRKKSWTGAEKFAPIVAMANADFDSASHTSASESGAKYRASQPKGGGGSVQASSLSLGQNVDAASLTVKDFFNLKDDKEGDDKPIVMLIVTGVGVLQGLILVVVVVRVLIEKAR